MHTTFTLANTDLHTFIIVCTCTCTMHAFMPPTTTTHTYACVHIHAGMLRLSRGISFHYVPLAPMPI